jgi:hypothetical protein
LVEKSSTKNKDWIVNSLLIWGSQSSGYEEYYLPGCNAIQYSTSSLTLRNLMAPLSGSKGKPSSTVLWNTGELLPDYICIPGYSTLQYWLYQQLFLYWTKVEMSNKDDNIPLHLLNPFIHSCNTKMEENTNMNISL